MSDSLSRRDALAAAGLGAVAFGLGLRPAAAADQMSQVTMPYQNGEYVLPALPYAYDALEPHIDEQTMRLHHDKHHAGYVAGLNKALAALAAARQANDYSAIQTLTGKVAFHGSGHVLHTVFWTNLRPAGGPGPSGLLADLLKRDFGGLQEFQAQFSAAAKTVEGSGWGILAFEPLSHKLVVLQAEKHQNLTAWGVTPLLVLDVWEHAYYLKYQNNRGEYIKQWWSVVNWDNVGQRLNHISQLA